MTEKNEAIKSYVGEFCEIALGQPSLATIISGKILNVKDHWIEVETKKARSS